MNESSSTSVSLNFQRNQAVIIWRVRLVQFIFTTCFLLVFGKAVYLQTIKADDLKRISDRQKRRSTPTTIFRGEITDRNGVVLAIDTARFDVFLRPKEYKASPEKAEKLAELLNLPLAKLSQSSKSKHIVKLASSIGRPKADLIGKLRIPGLDLMPINQRDYPQGKLAAHLLGFVTWDASGRAGIEESLDNTLRSAHSTANKVITRGDGRPITHLVSLRPILNSSFGQQVELTIDSKLQYRLESVLDKGIEKYKASRATAIVLDPSTGEILAWGNSPSYDPKFYGKYSPARTVNWAISQVYEPGSTFKVLTVASALQMNAIDVKFRYFDEGKLKIGNRTIKNHDYRPGKGKEIDLVELFRYSSNIASAAIGLKMEPAKFYEQLKKFGIASKTGVEIPGESPGALRDYKNWKELDRATTSFGQGAVAVTPIQLAAAINVVANKGEWVQPHLIRKVRAADGRKTISRFEPTRRRVISEKVAKQVNDLLAQSIKENIEKDPSYMAGKIPGYNVAGKTGTAQKYCPNLRAYCPGETIASFIGYFPAEKPEYLILVVVDSPKGAGGWGNTVAGPIFNEIGESILRIYPDGFPKEKSSLALFDNSN